MKFEATRCDECGRIQGESNHWQSLVIWESANSGVLAIAAGTLADLLILTRTAPPVSPAKIDLCGQGCAMRHVAKLLGWSTPGAGE